MLWIGLVAAVIFGLIILRAVSEIKNAPGSTDISAQCTPSRITYTEPPKRERLILTRLHPKERTEYPSKKDRWFGLERSMKEVKNEPAIRDR